MLNRQRATILFLILLSETVSSPMKCKALQQIRQHENEPTFEEHIANTYWSSHWHNIKVSYQHVDPLVYVIVCWY